MKISIVMPARNEGEIINRTIINLKDKLDVEHKIIVVDDHSIGNIADLVNNLMKQYQNLRLVHNDGERGFGAAFFKEGFLCSSADSDAIIPVMADLCDGPKTIKDICDKLKEGFELVCGSRYRKKGRLGGSDTIFF